MTAQDEGRRLRERALHAASAAYGAAHGHPLEHTTSAGVRWRTGTVALVAGAALLAVLVALVGTRAVVGRPPEPTVAPEVTPLAPDGGAATGPGGAGPVTSGDGVDGEGGAPPGAAGDERVLVVHVVGAVHRPGVVRLAPGSRVVDAVEMAGGPTADADLGGLNLARQVQDGEQVRVPLPGEEVAEPAPAPAAGEGGAPGAGAGTGPVDVNRATAAELETLPGIGPVLAERIVAHRTEHGPFASVEALTAVSGIGPRVLDGLREHVVAG